MSDYKNQAWSLKLEKSSARTISLCPLFGDHLFNLIHLPVVLIVHHHLNDNDYLPTSQHQHSLQLLHHQLVLSWYHHQPGQSHISKVSKRCCRELERPGPIDRTPETLGSGKYGIQAVEIEKSFEMS